MERIGETVRRELGRYGTAGAMADTVACWPDAVGEQVAANAWPARFARDGTLLVFASSSAWAFELGQLEGEILPRLRAALGKGAPKRLRFAPGPLPDRREPASARPRPAPPKPTPEQAREAHELAAPIASEELRKSVEKAARASLASSGYGRSIW
jgi:hypothetical protein